MPTQIIKPPFTVETARAKFKAAVERANKGGQ